MLYTRIDRQGLVFIYLSFCQVTPSRYILDGRYVMASLISGNNACGWDGRRVGRKNVKNIQHALSLYHLSSKTVCAGGVS